MKTVWFVGALFIGACAILVSTHAGYAAKKSIIEGKFDCSCKNGRGTCTIKTSNSDMYCYKNTGDTCTGNCALKTSTGGANNPAAKRGGAKGVTVPGGAKMKR